MIVYLITNLANGKYYVGQTRTSLEVRWIRHCREHRTYLSRAIKKHGRGSFVIEQIAVVETQAHLDLLEGLWIRLLASHVRGIGYNVRLAVKGYKTLPPESMERFRQKRLGHEVTQETRAKIAASLNEYYATHTNAKAGKPMKDSQREKLKALTGPRNSRFGKHDTPETIDRRVMSVRMAAPYRRKVKRLHGNMTGVPVSAETRKKRGDTMRATVAMKKACKAFDASQLLAEHAASNYF